MNISDFRLIKIKYDHTIKEFDSMTDPFTSDEIDWAINISNNTINHTIKKRNNIARKKCDDYYLSQISQANSLRDSCISFIYLRY